MKSVRMSQFIFFLSSFYNTQSKSLQPHPTSPLALPTYPQQALDYAIKACALREKIPTPGAVDAPAQMGLKGIREALDGSETCQTAEHTALMKAYEAVEATGKGRGQRAGVLL